MVKLIPTMSKNKISILGLMTCYNRKQKTENAIRQLSSLESGLVCVDFIVLDDGSRDGTREALEALDASILVLEGDGNSYYTGGMRQAMAAARERIQNSSHMQNAKDGETENTCKYDYILLFNDDVDFDLQAVARLVEKASLNPGKIWVGPTSDERGELSYGGVQLTSKLRPKYRIVKGDSQEGTPCQTFNANFVLVPTDIFMAMDSMDEVYQHSLGDFDYGLQATRRGYEILVSDEFIGTCPDNSVAGTYNDRSLSFRERIRKKESPKGVPAREWWHYLYKNYGLATALVYSVTPYIRILLGK